MLQTEITATQAAHVAALTTPATATAVPTTPIGAVIPGTAQATPVPTIPVGPLIGGPATTTAAM
jgi:hypothetical protein